MSKARSASAWSSASPLPTLAREQAEIVDVASHVRRSLGGWKFRDFLCGKWGRKANGWIKRMASPATPTGRRGREKILRCAQDDGVEDAVWVADRSRRSLAFAL